MILDRFDKVFTEINLRLAQIDLMTQVNLRSLQCDLLAHLDIVIYIKLRSQDLTHDERYSILLLEDQVKQCLRGLEDPRGHVALVVLNKVWVDAFESTQSSTKYIYV